MTYCFYIFAALAEIAGCFSFWAWLRLNQSIFYLIPGIFSLCLFAYFLTLIETNFAGRGYAAYGGIYIISSLLWMWVVEKNIPTQADMIGSICCLIGAIIIIRG